MPSPSRRPPPPHILVIPFPAQGHYLPLLDLIHHLCIRHFCSSTTTAVPTPLTITVVVTPKNAPFLDPLLQLPFPPTITINPLVLPLPPHPSLPAGAENVKDLPFAGYNAALAHAVSGLHEDVLQWAKSRADNPPTSVLADFFLGSLAGALAADLGVPHLVFFCSGALLAAVVHHLWAEDGSGVVEEEDSTLVSFPDIPGSPSFTYPQLPALYRRYRAGVPEWEAMRASMVANSFCYAAVINSSDVLEGVYLEHLRAVYGHSRVWAVGPLEPAEGPSGGSRGGPSSVPAEELTSWLDTCPVGSVLYVCFGSQYVIPRPHAAALAAALELSGVRFVWVIKEPATGCEGAATTVVPEGFEERVAGRGLVVRGWAPQVALLGHASVGAFLTHCGWNSVLEGVVAGVLLLTWPAEADQFINARLLVDELGVAARAWDGGHDAPAPEPGKLAKVIAESVGADEGRMREVRRKAVELGRKIREAVAAGGSSDIHWELMMKEVVMSVEPAS